VRFAKGLIRSTNASPASISTPASRYVMGTALGVAGALRVGELMAGFLSKIDILLNLAGLCGQSFIDAASFKTN
jgi:hypothetical protein